jgi:E3 ubiquitin-protein ligase TRIP12
VTKNRSPSFTLSSLPKDSPHAKILRLLRVLCQLNTIEAELVAFVSEDESAIGGIHDSR